MQLFTLAFVVTEELIGKTESQALGNFISALGSKVHQCILLMLTLAPSRAVKSNKQKCSGSGKDVRKCEKHQQTKSKARTA